MVDGVGGISESVENRHTESYRIEHKNKLYSELLYSNSATADEMSQSGMSYRFTPGNLIMLTDR
jgi:hypothetical protein